MLESKRKAIIFFLIAIVLAATSGFLVLNKVQALNTNLGTMVNIYVADKAIHSRTIITPNDITTDEIPKKYKRDDHIENVEDLINKVSLVPLSSGDVITKGMLKEASSVTEADNRLITLTKSEKVYFDESLDALDRVDIIVSNSFESEPVTEIFMKDVKVSRVARDDGEFVGVLLELPLEAVPKLIHMQNYADSVRIVKANVGQMQTEENEESTEVETEVSESVEESKNDSTENNQEKQKEEENEKEDKAGEKKDDKKSEEEDENDET
ncbi:flagella basal body P-ring formation protein FlgA [Virgibacillus sp. C22-A2]|uniref:Flagella basal body P-ring formation protein FlgA n=1 Tax=Virgibacillus tibetensis TaxID=3042313 RepID=A0ABU6KHZ7_9BACI|nr:flagella basal body P-ring formation protein FlgA [Virgibacillus sp. C22-A2]